MTNTLNKALPPARFHLAEAFRRRLGFLDPQQVAIWRQMKPAQKLQLLFQLWSFTPKVAWTTERQWHPDLSSEDLSRCVWRRIHGSELPDVSTGKSPCGPPLPADSASSTTK